MQPVASGGKSSARGSGRNKPNHGKEGVDGSSPSEGSGREFVDRVDDHIRDLTWDVVREEEDMAGDRHDVHVWACLENRPLVGRQPTAAVIKACV